MSNYSSYNPIIYSIILLFGIFLGKNLIKNDNYGQLNYINDLLKNNYVDTINIEKINEQIFRKFFLSLIRTPHIFQKNHFNKLMKI